jgi:hypothetical protein
MHGKELHGSFVNLYRNVISCAVWKTSQVDVYHFFDVGDYLIATYFLWSNNSLTIILTLWPIDYVNTTFSLSLSLMDGFLKISAGDWLR